MKQGVIWRYDMCCEPINYESKVVGECKECGSPIDADGDSTEVCAWCPIECEECGWAPCELSC